MGKLNARVSLITGGTKGIGFAFAERLYNEGGTVFICGRSEKTAKEAALKIDPSGLLVFGVSADVCDDESVVRLVKQIIKKTGRIDVLINCAGVFEPFGPFESMPWQEIVKAMEVNLIGTMRCCHNVLPYMKRQNIGRIILMAGGGIGGDTPLVHASTYYTSKGGIATFGEVLAAEVKSFGITVNTILPGQILTEMTKNTFDYSDEQLGPVLADATRNLRQSGGQSVEPVVNLMSFLVSDKAAHVSGKLLSARWDPQTELTDELPLDEYTMRRIKKGLYEKVIK